MGIICPLQSERAGGSIVVAARQAQSEAQIDASPVRRKACRRVEVLACFNRLLREKQPAEIEMALVLIRIDPQRPTQEFAAAIMGADSVRLVAGLEVLSAIESRQLGRVEWLLWGHRGSSLRTGDERGGVSGLPGVGRVGKQLSGAQIPCCGPNQDRQTGEQEAARQAGCRRRNGEIGV